jgi:hypothetical protein
MNFLPKLRVAGGLPRPAREKQHQVQNRKSGAAQDVCRAYFAPTNTAPASACFSEQQASVRPQMQLASAAAVAERSA